MISSSSSNDDDTTRLPNQIRPYLYLGAQTHTYKSVLTEIGITHILSCISGPIHHNPAEEFGPTVQHHLRVPMSDHGKSDLEGSIFPETFEFIHTALLESIQEQGSSSAAADRTLEDDIIPDSPNLSPVRCEEGDRGVGGDGEGGASPQQQQQVRVLIHCQAGINRSASVTVGWLMKSEGLSLKEAHKEVLERRGICIHDSYIEQLRDYDLALHGKHSTEEGELPCTSKMMAAAAASIGTREN